MPIVYPLDAPKPPATSRITIRSRSVVAVTESPFTLKQQAQEHQGHAWQLVAEYPPLREDQADVLVSFLLKLHGRAGTFLMGDRSRPRPRGNPRGTPLVAGAGQLGSDLVTDGWEPNARDLLRGGDWFTIGTGTSTRLFKALADVHSNGAGEATILCRPNLRPSPADNAPLEVQRPRGLWRLADNFTEWSVDEAMLYGVTFAAVEAVLL